MFSSTVPLHAPLCRALANPYVRADMMTAGYFTLVEYEALLVKRAKEEAADRAAAAAALKAAPEAEKPNYSKALA